MYTLGKRIGLAALASLVVLGVQLSDAQAQRVQTAGTRISAGAPGIFPYFQVAPGLNLQQAAYNTSIAARALNQLPLQGAFPPFSATSPFGGVSTPGFIPSPLNPANPFAFSQFAAGAYNPTNPFSLSANPYAFAGAYGGGAGGAGTATLTSGGLPGASAYDQAAGGYSSSVYPPGYGYPDPYSGYLRGAADVIGAQGRFMVSREQAHSLREDWLQKRLETHKKRVLQYIWDLKNIPTEQFMQERRDKIYLQRALKNPTAGEVTSGDTLNAILKDIRQLPPGVVGPRIAVDEKTLQNINFQVPGANGNPGLLKDENLQWPLALQTPDTNAQTELITSNLQRAILDVRNGQSPDPNSLRAMRQAVDTLRGNLRNNIRDLPLEQYTQAKRFLSDLDDALTVLAQPNAGKRLRTPQGATVAELVQWMNRNGVVFAPAVEGHDDDYHILQHKLAEYDEAARQKAQQIAEKEPGEKKESNSKGE